MKDNKSKTNITASVRAWAEPIAASHGLSIWDVEFKKEGADWILRVYIDADDRTISTDDCEAVSRELDVILDREDPIEQSYYLEISSPGLERVLSRPEHFAKFIGHDVSVKLYKETDGAKEFVGELVSYDDGMITVMTDGRKLKFDRKQAALIKLYVKF